MDMVNKRGVVKIVEAVIGILIVLGALLIISGQRGNLEGDEINLGLESILEELAKNESFRELVVGSSESERLDLEQELESFTQERINQLNYEVEVRICDLDNSCQSNIVIPRGVSVLSMERVISSSIKDGIGNPVKVKIFVFGN